MPGPSLRYRLEEEIRLRHEAEMAADELRDLCRRLAAKVKDQQRTIDQLVMKCSRTEEVA